MTSELSWRKSTFSGGQGGDCIEVADRDSVIVVRDTKDHGQGQVHTYSAGEWRQFVATLKACQLPVWRSQARRPPSHLRVAFFFDTLFARFQLAGCGRFQLAGCGRFQLAGCGRFQLAGCGRFQSSQWQKFISQNLHFLLMDIQLRDSITRCCISIGHLLCNKILHLYVTNPLPWQRGLC